MQRDVPKFALAGTIAARGGALAKSHKSRTVRSFYALEIAPVNALSKNHDIKERVRISHEIQYFNRRCTQACWQCRRGGSIGGEIRQPYTRLLFGIACARTKCSIVGG